MLKPFNHQSGGAVVIHFMRVPLYIYTLTHHLIVNAISTYLILCDQLACVWITNNIE